MHFAFFCTKISMIGHVFDQMFLFSVTPKSEIILLFSFHILFLPFPKYLLYPPSHPPRLFPCLIFASRSLEFTRTALALAAKQSPNNRAAVPLNDSVLTVGSCKRKQTPHCDFGCWTTLKVVGRYQKLY